MNYQKLIAVIIALIVWSFTGSKVMAHGGGHGGGFGGGGFGGGGGFRGGGFNRGGFRSDTFRGRGFNSGGFRRGGFRGDRFHHRDFDNRFVFFGDFVDPFFYYPYPYYGYYPYGYYPFDYGYGSYDERVYQGSARYADSLIGQLQLRLARAGYYHGAIDGVNGNATRNAIREYERAHSLPADGQIRGRLLTTMGMG
jgi:Putative peptidoglycan binding domain